MKKAETNGRRKYVFLAHWVETWNVWLQWSDDLQRHPSHSWRWAILWPIAFLLSVVRVVRRKAYDVVDRFKFGSTLNGEIWLVGFFAYQFMIKSLNLRERIRKKILRAVVAAQNSGIHVVGLGALCKDEGMTKGGEWIVEQLGELLCVPLIHGDTLTAAAVIQRARQLIEMFGLEGKPVMITGATSKIGRAVALDFARRGIKVYMFTNSLERFRFIQAEAGENAYLLCQTANLADGADAGLWITGKADKGAGERLVRHMPQGAVAMNFAVPDPLTPRLLKKRLDVRHFDGGLMGFDPEGTTLRFNMRLRPGMTYACHAGTMVHAAMGWAHHEVGPVRMDQLEVVWEAALQCGLDLPILTSFLEEVSEDGRPINKLPAGAKRRWLMKAIAW